MYRSVVALGISLSALTARADSTKPATAAKTPNAVFPVVAGTKLTFTCSDPNETWTTTIQTEVLSQYAPHHDVLDLFSQAGFRVDKDGLYVAGMWDDLVLSAKPDPPARVIAFPIKKGAAGKVAGGMTYKVVARQRVKVPAGNYDAWEIDVAEVLPPPTTPSLDYIATTRVWIAPGVGIVKIESPSGRIDELAKIEPGT